MTKEVNEEFNGYLQEILEEKVDNGELKNVYSMSGETGDFLLVEIDKKKTVIVRIG